MTVKQRIACQEIKSALGIEFTGTTQQELEAFIQKWHRRAVMAQQIINLENQMLQTDNTMQLGC